MFSILALPLNEYRDLPPNLFRLMTELASYTNRAGQCCPTMEQLAAGIRVSIATISRWAKALAKDYGLKRERGPNGRYHYTLPERFRPRWPGFSSKHAGFSQRGTQEAKPKHKIRFGTQEAGEMPDERHKWPSRMRWLKRNGSWPADAGPRPGEPGCRVPPQYL
jgi:hypothetical protein